MKTTGSSLKTFLAIVLLLLAIIAGWYLFNWVITGQDKKAVAYGDNGVWDLRALFNEYDTFSLLGPVEYIPNAILTPDEFKARENEIVIGEPQNSYQYATSRIRILLPDDGYYAFNRRSVDYAHRIYVNGTLVMEMGSPGETRETNKPDTGEFYFTAKAELTEHGYVIELIQQASNFVHREGASHDQINIRKRDFRPFLSHHYSNSFLLWDFFTLFIVHIFLFRLLPEYKGNLYFALFCFIWFLRTGVTGTKIFTTIFPVIPWEIKFRVEYLTIPATAAVLILLLNILFPKILHKFFRYTLYGVSAVIGIIFIFADTVFMSYALLAVESIYILAIVYIVVRFAMKLRGMDSGQCIFLAGVFVFFIAVIIDSFTYYKSFFNISFLSGNDMTTIAMILLTYCQAAAMFMVTGKLMKETAAENAVLKEKLRSQTAVQPLKPHDAIFKEHKLSNREIDVAILLLNEGLSAKEIGERLFISTRTVNDHIAGIYQKFDVRKLGEFMSLFISK